MPGFQLEIGPHPDERQQLQQRLSAHDQDREPQAPRVKGSMHWGEEGGEHVFLEFDLPI